MGQQIALGLADGLLIVGATVAACFICLTLAYIHIRNQ
jgi:hypothetical protein